MERVLNISWLLPTSMTGIGALAYYHAFLKPTVWTFLFVAVIYRLFAYVLWYTSATFFKAPPPPLPPPAPVLAKEEEEEEEGAENAKELHDPPLPAVANDAPVVPPAAPTRARDEVEAMSWALAHVKRENDGTYLVKKIYRFYELWIPLALRSENAEGVPRWFSVMHTLTKTSTIIAILAIAIALSFAFSYRLTQEPILGLINCDKEVIDAALHCDAYTESCHLTPPCGQYGVDYVKLVETYHNRCTGSAYPKIAMIKNVCFMDKDGNDDQNSWRHIWMKMVGSDFYALERTLISFYRDPQRSPGELKEFMNEPVRVYYDQIGSLVGYGVNTVTPSGVTRTNINHDDVMSTITTWRNKKLQERKRQKPCICAPHLGILNRMMFMWEEDINQWKIYLDHNVSKVNTVYGDSNLFPKYDDFPRNVNTEITTSIRGESAKTIQSRPYPAASTIDLLEVNMDISKARPSDIQTTQQIRRHWSLEGPVLQSQIPHVYFDASLETYYRPKSVAFSGMSRSDGVVLSQRITDPIAACYYQCARIFDEVEQ